MNVAVARMIERRRLRAAGIRWLSPDRRWSIAGGGPKSIGCRYVLRDTVTGNTRSMRTLREAKAYALARPRGDS